MKQFSSTYQPKKNGRKPSHLKKWFKDNSVSTQDIRILVAKIITEARSIDGLKDLLLDKDTPAIVALPIKALLSDYAHGKIDTLIWLIEYGFGKAVQENRNINAEVGDTLTPEKRREIIAKLLKRGGYIEDNRD